ncbi:hypothetical protein B0F90DRAFT_1716832 [Multifurca ochricompacta]|uniref:CFEM domain-containing protein n=1 Tax=Multifurca ochricompacta TaxID=376703 RepID=A0AAD4QNZ4_9AGAM|nr:hypothetical protein B0F90DRAFT_1716832 [Multifurca ochricompacta]
MLKCLLACALILYLCAMFSISEAQTKPPACATICARAAASQTGCNIYAVACFCSNSQFMPAVGVCIEDTCNFPDVQAASVFIGSLCSMGSAGWGTATSSSDPPFSTSQNAAATMGAHIAAILGGGIGVILAVVISRFWL